MSYKDSSENKKYCCNYYQAHKVELRRKAREYYRSHKEKRKIQQRQREHQVRLEVMEHYGGARCACCGETRIQFLGFDHIEGGGTCHRKSLGSAGRRIYYWLRSNGYPKGFRVLCHNCNMSLGFYGYCPHQKEEKEI